MNEITDDYLFKAIQEALEQEAPDDREPGTIISSEVAEHFGVSKYIAMTILKKMYKAGLLERAYVHRSNGWGLQAIKGYRIRSQDDSLAKNST